MSSTVIPAKAGIHSYKILVILFSAACLSLFLSIMPAQAADTTQNAGKDMLGFMDITASKSGLGSGASVYDIIAAIINTVLGLTGIIFFVQVFWAGFRWMTANGAEEAITTAKKTIVNSVIGITIALSAFVITNFVLNKIEEINGSGNTALPTQTSTSEPGFCQVEIQQGANPPVWNACHPSTQQACADEAKELNFSWSAYEANCTKNTTQSENLDAAPDAEESEPPSA